MKQLAQISLLLLAGSFAAGTVRAATAPTARGLAEAPVFFEENQGQTDGGALFVARSRDCAVLIGRTDATFVVAKEGETRKVRVSLVGANPLAAVSGLNEFSGRAGYFLGNDRARWRAGVRLFGSVKLEDVYPGIQLIYYPSDTARLEYDFLVQPGANPDQIALRIAGADSVRVDHGGDLVLKIGADEIRQRKPALYQTVNGARKSVAGGWRLIGKSTAAFSIGDYDHSLPLVIDPLTFSTYLGGSLRDNGWDITTDANGNVYVCGDTLSPNLRAPFPNVPFVSYSKARTGRTYGGTRGTAQYGDAFVAKFTPTVSNTLQLAYISYLGGAGQDAALGIAADAQGNAYVTGFTDSENFPTTPHAAFPKITGNNHTPSHIYRTDAFVAKIDSSGSNLVYSTYLGGGERDSGNAIAVDGAGFAYVTGFTQSRDFPAGTNLNSAIGNRLTAALNSNVTLPRFGGGMDAFVTKVGAEGTNLVYSTFLGGRQQDAGTSIKVDSAGAAYVAGFTLSPNFPVMPTNNSYLNGTTRAQALSRFDGFVSRLSPDASALDYSAFLGGGAADVALRLALNSSNDIFVAGYTSSTNFPKTTTIAGTRTWSDPVANAASDIFLTRLHLGEDMVYSATNPPGYSVVFGGGRVDQATGLAVDAEGNAILAGLTSSTNLFGSATSKVLVGTNYVTVTNTIPFDYYYGTNYSIVTNSIASTNKLRNSLRLTYAFIAAVNPDASAFSYKAYLGGSGDDAVHGLAYDAGSGNAYLVGSTTSRNFPAVSPVETRPGGANTRDAFVAAFSLNDALPVLEHASHTINGAAIQPTLDITETNGVVTITWADVGLDFVLERSDSLSPMNWSQVGKLPVLNGGWNAVDLPTTNTSGFFRLRYP